MDKLHHRNEGDLSGPYLYLLIPGLKTIMPQFNVPESDQYVFNDQRALCRRFPLISPVNIYRCLRGLGFDREGPRKGGEACRYGLVEIHIIKAVY